ncbi:hypothetical protein [Mesorhizobium sp. CAU 1741]|uniref:hypothetical protein n=1 Tax=Mesorhizobium sp. CAU 1741 TaxID=3140366 RepID=UPI00325B7F8A
MLRFALIAVALLAAAWLLVRLWNEMRRTDVDWRGMAFAAGFVALAVYLSQVTDIGGFG